MPSLHGLLDKAISNGRLTVTDAKGQTRIYGGKSPGPEAAIRFTTPTVARKIFLNPELKAAEAYMDGELIMTDGTVHDLIRLFFANKRQFDLSASQNLLARRGPRVQALPAEQRVCRGRAAMCRRITTSARKSTGSFSMPTCNIPAPIFPMAPRRSSRRRR